MAEAVTAQKQDPVLSIAPLEKPGDTTNRTDAAILDMLASFPALPPLPSSPQQIDAAATAGMALTALPELTPPVHEQSLGAMITDEQTNSAMDTIITNVLPLKPPASGSPSTTETVGAAATQPEKVVMTPVKSMSSRLKPADINRIDSLIDAPPMQY
ncbi:MAG: hypothetical protein LIP23_09535 [Planctomycetes bacterium]|nr:hypothetical protein [Planctomycetota bacterium]